MYDGHYPCTCMLMYIHIYVVSVTVHAHDGIAPMACDGSTNRKLLPLLLFHSLYNIVHIIFMSKYLIIVISTNVTFGGIISSENLKLQFKKNYTCITVMPVK